MRKPGELKLSLSSPRGGKILNSTMGDRESVGGGRGEESVLKVGVLNLGAW